MAAHFTGLWRHGDFVRLWAGQTISVFGSLLGGLALDFTAVLWLRATPLEVSVLTACRLVPGFAFGLVAGAWVDRLSRRPIMIVADASRALALVTIPVAAMAGHLTIEQLYFVAVVTSALNVFFVVAYEAYLPALVARSELLEGNSKLASTASISEFAAFSASGWLVQLLSGPGAIVIDAASFLISAISIWRIRTPEPRPPTSDAHRPLLHEVQEGLQFVAHEPILRSLAVANFIRGFAGRLIGVTYLLYLSREVGFAPGILGMIFAVGGLTSVAGAAVANRWHQIGLGTALVIAVFVEGVGMAFMPLAASVSLFGVSALVANQVVVDPAETFYTINFVSVRQSISPERLIGRVNASMHFVDFSAMLAGTFTAGVLGQTIGLRPTLFLAAAATVAASSWLLFSPVRGLRRMPAQSAR